MSGSAQPTPVRFEATIRPGQTASLEVRRIADLDLDRVPDPDGEVRVLVGVEDCVRLVEQGYEVRLHRVVPVRPLDGRLIAAENDVRAWFAERVRSTGRSAS